MNICENLTTIANRISLGAGRACATNTGMADLVLKTGAAAIAAGLFAAIVGASAPGVFLASAFVGICVFAKVSYDYGAPVGGRLSRVIDEVKDFRNNADEGVQQVKRQAERLASDMSRGAEQLGNDIEELGDGIASGVNSFFNGAPGDERPQRSAPAPRATSRAPRASYGTASGTSRTSNLGAAAREFAANASRLNQQEETRARAAKKDGDCIVS